MRGSGEESRESNTALGIEEPQATTEHLVATISLSPQCNLGAMCSGSLVRILVGSRESNTALGVEEPECVYVYVPASEFGANSL